MSKKNELKDMKLPDGPVAPPPPPLGKPPLDEVPDRTGEFLMRKEVPVPPEPIEISPHELLDDADADHGPPPLPPPLPLASDDPAIMAEVEATTREVRERAAARERSELLGKPIPPAIAERTALNRPATTMEDVKRIAGAAIAKEKARREAEASEAIRLKEAARADATAVAEATQVVVEHHQAAFFEEGEQLDRVIAVADPLPLDDDPVPREMGWMARLNRKKPDSSASKLKFDEVEEPVLSEPWWKEFKKEFKMPKFTIPRMSMPWEKVTPVTEIDNDTGYEKSSLPSPEKKGRRFALIMVALVALVLFFPLRLIFFGEDVGISTTEKPAEIAKVTALEQPKEEKQAPIVSNTTATPTTPPSTAPTASPAGQTAQPSASAPPQVASAKLEPAPSAPPEKSDVPVKKVVEAPPQASAAPVAPKSATPVGKAVEQHLAKQAPVPVPKEPRAPPVAKATPPAPAAKAALVQPTKAPAVSAQAPARQPTAVAKAAQPAPSLSKTVVAKAPVAPSVPTKGSTATPVPLPVPPAPPTEVCGGVRVHCSEGLAACLERVTLAHDKHVAKGACTWKCGAPCILPASTQASVVPPPVASPEPPPEPSPSLATSSPPAVPCPEGKELCILKFKLRLGEAAARGACWRCTK